MKYLFIGGVADGKRLNIDEKLHRESTLYEGEMYNRTVIYDNTFYAHHELNNSDICMLVKILLDNYSDNTDDFEEEKPISEYLIPNKKPKSNNRSALGVVQDLIDDECRNIKIMLIEKNKSYGNSAIEPTKYFSKLNWEDRVNVRIDDKINRIAKGSEFIGEDTELDLIGYLILKRVGRQFHKEQVTKEK